MSDPARRTSSEELLLARISAAAGRERLGRRRATYAAAAHTARRARGKALTAPGVRGLLALVRPGGFTRAAGPRDAARVDLYENGMTIAVKRRIHVVRYDTTSVSRTEPMRPGGGGRGGAASTLTDVDGERVVLRCEPEHGEAPEWWPEVEQEVIRAQLPRALTALAGGERLAFGAVWLTREEIGWGEVRAGWPRVRRLRSGPRSVGLDIDGTWHDLGPGGPGIVNLPVLRALVERLGRGPGERFHHEAEGST
ncbi:hypothetical protein [Streptomyces sp. NPDC008001]|uniref:hypothetical protein n=1 Tax=Streptomyces sp. NPDC008001 TaxID=3364804 RepID=UPI0036F140BA